jgi:hypothetical protein
MRPHSIQSTNCISTFPGKTFVVVVSGARSKPSQKPASIKKGAHTESGFCVMGPHAIVCRQRGQNYQVPNDALFSTTDFA